MDNQRNDKYTKENPYTILTINVRIAVYYILI